MLHYCLPMRSASIYLSQKIGRKGLSFSKEGSIKLERTELGEQDERGWSDKPVDQTMFDS